MTIPPPKFKNKYRIASTRLKEWDYGSPGYYFITICTKNSMGWFGEIQVDEMILSPVGDIVAQHLQKIPHIYPNNSLDNWIVMPNHIHAIIVIGENSGASVETPHCGVSTNKQKWNPGTQGVIISQYKSSCTKRIHAMGCKDFAWQARFYDHIIRSEKSLENIREYIIGNPIKWVEDEYYSDFSI